MKFELDDDAVLRLSGVAAAVYATALVAAPRKSHDHFYVSQAGRAGSSCRTGGGRLGRAARRAPSLRGTQPACHPCPRCRPATLLPVTLCTVQAHSRRPTAGGPQQAAHSRRQPQHGACRAGSSPNSALLS